jgi:hypothetical protein
MDKQLMNKQDLESLGFKDSWTTKKLIKKFFNCFCLVTYFFLQ